jgi:hypothetical protein
LIIAGLLNSVILYFNYESTSKNPIFWTKVHKLLNFNYPSLKAGVRQTAIKQGFSPYKYGHMIFQMWTQECFPKIEIKVHQSGRNE